MEIFTFTDATNALSILVGYVTNNAPFIIGLLAMTAGLGWIVKTFKQYAVPANIDGYNVVYSDKVNRLAEKMGVGGGEAAEILGERATYQRVEKFQPNYNHAEVDALLEDFKRHKREEQQDYYRARYRRTISDAESAIAENRRLMG